MIPNVILENDRLVTALVVVVRQLVRTIVVQDKRTGDRGRADDIGIDPKRDSVVLAPVFAGKVSSRDQIFPLARALNLRDIGRRTDSERMPAIFDVDIGQRHLSRPGERPVGKVLHAIQHSRIEDFLVQPTEFGAVFISRLHRHLGSDLCAERYAPTKDAQYGGNAEPAYLARPPAPS